MQVEKVTIHNFKAIKHYKGDIGGKNVYLIGGNGVGKTSFIDAIFKGISGKNLPPEPITDNGKKGITEIDLGDFIARTKYSKGRAASFELENKVYTDDTDKFIKSPRTFLEKKVGVLDFSIDSFLALSETKKVEYVARYMDVDFSDIDVEIEDLMESRKYDKKKLAELKTKQDYYKEEDAARDIVDIVAVSKKIEAETAKSAAVQKIKDGITTREARVSSIDAQIAALILERDGGVDAHGENVKGLKNEIADGEAWVNNPDNALITDEELAQLIQERDKATVINENIRIAKEAKEADRLIDITEEAIKEATAEIANLKQDKADRLGAVIKMDGLTYDAAAECFLYQNRPFDKTQTNTAAQLITGMKIGAMLLKELKILRIDASLIDEVEFEKVLAWADENKIQLFVELVDRQATQLKIEVVDE